MGLFDDIPMVGGAGARHQTDFDPMAGQMPIEAEPSGEGEWPEWSDPIRLAQGRGLSLPLPGIPGGAGVSPDVWETWRKGALDGIMGARRFYRRSMGPGAWGADDDGCKQERDAAHEACVKEFAEGWRGNNVHGPFKRRDWSIQDCVRGLISERCRGNEVDYGRDKNGKRRRR